jgi:hypothetical protein
MSSFWASRWRPLRSSSSTWGARVAQWGEEGAAGLRGQKKGRNRYRPPHLSLRALHQVRGMVGLRGVAPRVVPAAAPELGMLPCEEDAFVHVSAPARRGALGPAAGGPQICGAGIRGEGVVASQRRRYAPVLEDEGFRDWDVDAFTRGGEQPQPARGRVLRRSTCCICQTLLGSLGGAGGASKTD